MWMMKYMHKIYVVLQGMVIPDDIPASISSLRRALLMSHVMPHHLHCKIKTQYFHHADAEQIHLYFYLHLFLLSPSPCLYLFDTHLKCYCFIIVLCTLTNIVKQVIEDLHAHVHVGWKILLAPRKKVHVHLCKCACLKSSTELGQRVSIVLDFFPETGDRPGIILHAFLPFYYRRCPSRTTGWKLKLCKVTIEWKVCEFCHIKDWFKWLVFRLVHQLQLMICCNVRD